VNLYFKPTKNRQLPVFFACLLHRARGDIALLLWQIAADLRFYSLNLILIKVSILQAADNSPALSISVFCTFADLFSSKV